MTSTRDAALRLLEIDVARRRLDDEARAIAEALAADQVEILRPRMIDTSRAARIAGRSYSWLYSQAGRFGFGRKLPTGAWVFDEARLRAFLDGADASDPADLRTL